MTNQMCEAIVTSRYPAVKRLAGSILFLKIKKKRIKSGFQNDRFEVDFAISVRVALVDRLLEDDYDFIAPSGRIKP